MTEGVPAGGEEKTVECPNAILRIWEVPLLPVELVTALGFWLEKSNLILSFTKKRGTGLDPLSLIRLVRSDLHCTLLLIPWPLKNIKSDSRKKKYARKCFRYFFSLTERAQGQNE